MKKQVYWLYNHIGKIRIMNDISAIVIGLLFFVLGLMAENGGIFKYHHEVSIIEEISCNPHTDTCQVNGIINDEVSSFIIFDGYKKSDNYYQQCSLIVYTWYCGDMLYVKPDYGYEKSYVMVRG